MKNLLLSLFFLVFIAGQAQIAHPSFNYKAGTGRVGEINRRIEGNPALKGFFKTYDITDQDIKTNINLTTISEDRTKQTDQSVSVDRAFLDSHVGYFYNDGLAENATYYISFGDQLKAIRKYAYARHDAVNATYRKNILDGDALSTKAAELVAIQKDKTDYLDKLYSCWLSKSRGRWLPTRNSTFAGRFYGSNFDFPIEPLKNNFLQLNGQSVGFYSEIVSSTYGPIRLSIGAFISKTQLNNINLDSAGTQNIAHIADSLYQQNTTKNDQTQALNNLLNGGGNLMLISSLPIIDADDDDVFNKVKFTAYAVNKMAINISQLGNGSGNASFLNQSSIETYLAINFTNNPNNSDLMGRALTLFISTNSALVTGSRNFFQQLGLSDNNKKAFGNFSFKV
ncbi:MAG: hypothetical protein JST76_10165, partial [Bacteroidetes bacterium]|nr:hypothetical protein [Bacteroidota bacterium]